MKDDTLLTSATVDPLVRAIAQAKAVAQRTAGRPEPLVLAIARARAAAQRTADRPDPLVLAIARARVAARRAAGRPEPLVLAIARAKARNRVLVASTARTRQRGRARAPQRRAHAARRRPRRGDGDGDPPGPAPSTVPAPPSARWRRPPAAAARCPRHAPVALPGKTYYNCARNGKEHHPDPSAHARAEARTGSRGGPGLPVGRAVRHEGARPAPPEARAVGACGCGGFAHAGAALPPRSGGTR